jgi:hypothetical protein
MIHKDPTVLGTLRLPAIATIVTVAVVVSLAPLVTTSVSVPAMVVVHDAAASFPTTGEILSAGVIRRHPVRTLVRHARPVAIVPPVAAPLWIPITLNPHVVGTGLPPDDVPARRRRRLADLNANGNLSVRNRWREKQRRDGECPNKSSHAVR